MFQSKGNYKQKEEKLKLSFFKVKYMTKTFYTYIFIAMLKSTYAHIIFGAY